MGFTILTSTYLVINNVLNLIKISLFFLNRNIQGIRRIIPDYTRSLLLILMKQSL